jgi:hypothetical protein
MRLLGGDSLGQVGEGFPALVFAVFYDRGVYTNGRNRINTLDFDFLRERGNEGKRSPDRRTSIGREYTSPFDKGSVVGSDRVKGDLREDRGEGEGRFSDDDRIGYEVLDRRVFFLLDLDRGSVLRYVKGERAE